jgi:uncharacterized protein (TIGR02271 family)
MGELDNAEASDGQCADLAENDELRIPLAREEFTATTRPIRGGSVRIAKRVVTEDQILEVPVTEEEIRVERRVVERAGDASGAEAFEQIVIEIPLYRERLEVQKRTRMSDEIIVTKETTQRTERVRDTVRREEVFIDGAAAVIDADGSETPSQL